MFQNVYMNVSRRYSVILILFTVLLSGCLHAAEEQKINDTKRGTMTEKQSVVPGEYLVTLAEKGNESDIRQCFSGVDINSITKIRGNVYRIVVPETTRFESLQEQVKKCPIVERIQPNYIYRSSPFKSGKNY